MFSYVVTITGWTKSPVMAKFSLHYSSSQPVETHVHGFGPPWGDDVVDKFEGRGVVGFHWRRFLRMAHCNERMTGGDGLLSIDI